MHKLLRGDCLEQLKTLPDNSVDSIVTDPPYGLSFMGKKWDYDVPTTEVWKECLRVLKPGGHLLAFFGTRTYHRGVVRIEDAGFEIRDQIAWLYGQGFPKSTNVLKSGLKQELFCGCLQTTESQVSSLRDSGISETISTEETETNPLQSILSKQNVRGPSKGAKPEKSVEVGEESCLEGRGNVQTEQRELHRSEVCEMSAEIFANGSQGRLCDGASLDNGNVPESLPSEGRSSSSQRSQYSKQQYRESRIIPEQSSSQTCRSCGKTLCDPGLGTALKPSIEPIVVARKPLEKGLTVAENVQKWGTGAINIDESRIGTEARPAMIRTSTVVKNSSTENPTTGATSNGEMTNQGRWPANVIFDEEAAVVLDEQSGILKTGGQKLSSKSGFQTELVGGKATWDNKGSTATAYIGDSGGASRFFYVAKASKRERNAGLEGMPKVKGGSMNGAETRPGKPTNHPERENFHPTVKPIKLMQYLINLVTPPNGSVLDPFMGSGSTGVAAKNLGREFIGIELSPEYFEIAQKRIENA